MRSLVVFAISLTCSAGIARAAEPTADQLIARGLELRRLSRPGEALDMFRRAHALAASPRTFGQMGLAEASLERWIDADTHLTAALAATTDGWVRRNRALLVQALNVGRGHIGELVVTGPAGTSIAIDGQPIGALPAIRRIRIAEGKAVVTANNAGFRDFSKTVTVTAGAKISLAIVLDVIEQRPAVAVAAPEPLSPASVVPIIDSGADREARSWKTPVGAGLAAAGAGLMAWGIVWIAIDRNDACPMSGPACNAIYDTGRRAQILTAGGAAAAGLGAVLLYLGRRSDSSDVAFDVTPRSVSVRGRF
jgi:hypothetical protein